MLQKNTPSYKEAAVYYAMKQCQNKNYFKQFYPIMNNSERQNNRNKKATYNFQSFSRSYLPSASIQLCPKDRKNLKTPAAKYIIKCQAKIKTEIYLAKHGAKGNVPSRYYLNYNKSGGKLSRNIKQIRQGLKVSVFKKRYKTVRNRAGALKQIKIFFLTGCPTPWPSRCGRG